MAAGFGMASFHTVLCHRGCSLVHNDLILALQEPNSIQGGESEEKRKSRQKKNEVFRRCVDRLLENNWKKNNDLPEALERLRYPLVHVCCLLGKPKALEFLINSRGFDPAVQCSRTGETALHATLRYFYDIHNPRSRQTCLSRNDARKNNNECIAMFEKLLRILTSSSDSVLHVKDCVTRVTVFHLAAVKRTEASKELKTHSASAGFHVFKADQRDCMRELLLKNERGFYDRCLRLLAAELDENAGLEVLKFDTNRRGQSVVDILAADPCDSAFETLHFLTNRFPALHAVLQGKFRTQSEPTSEPMEGEHASAGTHQETGDNLSNRFPALHAVLQGKFRTQSEPTSEPTKGEHASAGTCQETGDNQEMKSLPPPLLEHHVSSSPELACPTEASLQADSQPDHCQRVDVHGAVVVKVEHDEQKGDACTGTTKLDPHGGLATAQSSTQCPLQELWMQRGSLSSSMATVSSSVSQGAVLHEASYTLTASSNPGPSGTQNVPAKCSAAVLSPFLELVIKEGIELDETTHNSIMSAIEQRCSEKLSAIDSKLCALNEQSLTNEKEINERFFLVQKRKAQMDTLRNEIVAMNRQIGTLQNELERKVEMGKMLQLEIQQLERDMNKTKEFGSALELKRKQLSEEQHQMEGKLSLCGGRKQVVTSSHPHKKPKT